MGVSRPHAKRLPTLIDILIVQQPVGQSSDPLFLARVRFEYDAVVRNRDPRAAVEIIHTTSFTYDPFGYTPATVSEVTSDLPSPFERTLQMPVWPSLPRIAQQPDGTISVQTHGVFDRLT